MIEGTPRNPRNGTRNEVGDIDGEGDITQVSDIDSRSDKSPDDGPVVNKVGNISGNARIVQARNISGDINL